MSEVSPKDPVSLEDLQQAIAAIPAKPSIERPWDEYIAASDAHQHARAEAWRTAFEWRDGIDRRREHLKQEGVIHSGALYGEYQHGMRLIREKLS